jgi:hypothetical protein
LDFDDSNPSNDSQKLIKNWDFDDPNSSNYSQKIITNWDFDDPNPILQITHRRSSQIGFR